MSQNENRPEFDRECFQRFVKTALTFTGQQRIIEAMDMLLAKKRSRDRKAWLEKEGDLADQEAL